MFLYIVKARLVLQCETYKLLFNKPADARKIICSEERILPLLSTAPQIALNVNFRLTKAKTAREQIVED